MTHASPRLKAGDRVGPNLELERELARGAMGVVWRARHLQLGIPVAVKFLDAATETADTSARFSVEAMVMARVSTLSPDIVGILDAGHHGALRYLVMEYVAGSSLEGILEDGPLAVADVRHIATRVAGAIDALHVAGYVHRDIKPANILVDAQLENVKLADFGVVKVTGPTSFDVRATNTGSVLGSPAYLSPEHIGGAPTSPAQDHWGLSVMTYELLTGQLPFDGATFGALVAQICSGRFAQPSRRGLPVGLDAVFQRAFKREPSARFDTAAAFARALDEALTAAAPRDAAPPASQVELDLRVRDTVLDTSSLARSVASTPKRPIPVLVIFAAAALVGASIFGVFVAKRPTTQVEALSVQPPALVADQVLGETAQVEATHEAERSVVAEAAASPEHRSHAGSPSARAERSPSAVTAAPGVAPTAETARAAGALRARMPVSKSEVY